MIPVGEMTPSELAAYVAEALREAGIEIVLTGGMCASIHADNRFGSLDLDFVDVGYNTTNRIKRAMARIGFSPRSSTRYYEHPDTNITVEFPSPPLMVGDQRVEIEDTIAMETRAGVFRLLSPTDCIKDRLSAYYYHRDYQCLEQALLVAQSHPVDWPSLEQWHKDEGALDKFYEFRVQAGKSGAKSR